jgi:hypothetical protein
MKRRDVSCLCLAFAKGHSYGFNTDSGKVSGGSDSSPRSGDVIFMLTLANHVPWDTRAGVLAVRITHPLPYVFLGSTSNSRGRRHVLVFLCLQYDDLL